MNYPFLINESQSSSSFNEEHMMQHQGSLQSSNQHAQNSNISEGIQLANHASGSMFTDHNYGHTANQNKNSSHNNDSHYSYCINYSQCNNNSHFQNESQCYNESCLIDRCFQPNLRERIQQRLNKDKSKSCNKKLEKQPKQPKKINKETTFRPQAIKQELQKGKVSKNIEKLVRECLPNKPRKASSYLNLTFQERQEKTLTSRKKKVEDIKKAMQEKIRRQCTFQPKFTPYRLLLLH